MLDFWAELLLKEVREGWGEPAVRTDRDGCVVLVARDIAERMGLDRMTRG